MNPFVKNLTVAYGISQKELAEMLGITSAAISQWDGAESISIDILYKLSRLLQTSADELLEGILPDAAQVDKLCEEFEWLRKFKIDAAVAMRDNQALKYFGAYKKLKSRYFELAYRRVAGKLREALYAELEYLTTFYSFTENATREYGDETSLINYLSGISDKKAVIWELEQAYKCNLKLPWKACFETLDAKLYLSAYDCLRSIDKDEIVTAFRYINYRWLPNELRARQGVNLPDYIQNTVFEMINHGGQVRYNIGHDRSHMYGAKQKGQENKLQLISLPMPHVKNTEKIAVWRVADEWNEAEQILAAIDGTFTNTKATVIKTVHYAEYMKTVNMEEMNRIKTTYVAEKENIAVTDPIKYWDMVKDNRIWIPELH